MSKDRFDKAVEAWLAGTPSWFLRAWSWLAANYYKRIWNRNIRARPVMVIAVKALVPAATPLLAYRFGANAMMTLPSALLWSGTIFLVAVTVDLAQTLLSLKHGDSAAAEELMTRTCELLRLCGDDAIVATNRPAARNACLSMIEVYVRSLTNAARGEIGVSLARYVPGQPGMLRIDERNAGSLRKMGVTFPGRFVIGHHACMAGDDPRIVNDILSFGPEALRSPTGSRTPYRSFFIVPICVTLRDGLIPLGYLSIDSTRPYEFYGNRANVLAVECESIIARLKKLMQEVHA
ncbi:hypothetical protein [uncultured Paracoccus sp.]|uniref:hypothetical protein n=1 Tax=uncultured Paracoccus sp. TaxID=189685 RepID=UPI0025E9AC04|nr:hypothetical protein [uncultured Paracoccus sp.]